MFLAEQYMKHLDFKHKHTDVSTVNTDDDTNNDICKINDKEYLELLEGKMPSWDQMRKLQYD
jgi:hypothetical protein